MTEEQKGLKTAAKLQSLVRLAFDLFLLYVPLNQGKVSHTLAKILFI